MSDSTEKQSQQGRLLDFKDFHLMSFKMQGNGLTVKHHLGGADPQTQTNDCDFMPHPDLRKTMDKLSLYMATRLGLLEGWDFAREKLALLKDSDSLKSAMDLHAEVVSRMNVNGLTFKGEGETLGVSITGSIKLPKGGSIGLAVPKICFEKEDLGYEEEIEEICNEITKEVYNYVILRKKEQTNIEDQAEGFDNDGNSNQLELITGDGEK